VNVRRLAGRSIGAFVLWCSCSAPTAAAEWFVGRGGTGPGTTGMPFGRIQHALKVAQPGDTITVREGTYRESLRTVRHGASLAPIRLRALGERGTVMVTAPGRVLTVNHRYITVEGLLIDGQYGRSDTISVGSDGDFLTIRNTEVRRSTHDLIDLKDPVGVLIEHCVIHHALNAADGRRDAHGIAAGAVQNFTVRNTDIHTFSGDGVQLDPDRSAPGWKAVTLDTVRIWLAPLPVPENGFAAGIVPGENGVDTKASDQLPRATLTIRNTTAWGFRNGLIGNMAAFNLKENITATLDRVTVFDSEIAFRVRGGGASSPGAWVTLTNAVVHDVVTAYRYENSVENLCIWNNTVGNGVRRAFEAAESTTTGLNVRNLLVLGSRPKEAAGASNMAVSARVFVDAMHHDYRLAAGAPAIDAGVSLSAVTSDRHGVPRPVGVAYDIGAHEWHPPGAGEVATRPSGRMKIPL
jgi:hypothetical protein